MSLFFSDYTTSLKLIATIFVNIITILIFVMVFHRILDFKTGLDFYPGPFFISGGPCRSVSAVFRPWIYPQQPPILLPRSL